MIYDIRFEPFVKLRIKFLIFDLMLEGTIEYSDAIGRNYSTDASVSAFSRTRKDEGNTEH